MKASQHQEIEKTSLILSEKIPKLSESEKAFVEGILTGLQMNKAQPAPAAKEPEKKEEANVQGTPRTNASTTGSHM